MIFMLSVDWFFCVYIVDNKNIACLAPLSDIFDYFHIWDLTHWKHELQQLLLRCYSYSVTYNYIAIAMFMYWFVKFWKITAIRYVIQL